MPIAPIITFKAGKCGTNSKNPIKVKPEPEPGYLYLYSEDDLVHFCWRRREDPVDDPELDLVMVPTDGTFVPHEPEDSQSTKTNGRVFVLKFGSSSERHFFWLQSKPQGRSGNPSYFSPRDRKIGDIVNRLLQGEEVNVTRELNNLRNPHNHDDDDDETMEDAQAPAAPRARHGSASGGAGADATGGDIREEGEDSREGGGDGARAASSSAPDAAAAVRNFLASIQGQQELARGTTNQQLADIPYPHLNHLLPTSTTVPMIDVASTEYLDSLLSFLPPSVIALAVNPSRDSKTEPSPAEVESAKASMPLEDKRMLLRKVLRSPQFHQSLGTLTMALRDGGLPSIADALGIHVQNGGYIQQGSVPMGGGQAVEAFVEGVKRAARESQKKE